MSVVVPVRNEAQRIAACLDVRQDRSRLLTRLRQSEARRVAAKCDVFDLTADTLADDEGSPARHAKPDAQAWHDRVANLDLAGCGRLHRGELCVGQSYRVHAKTL